MEKPKAILIAGPTASGKSGLALRLAERLGGVVVNADSIQVYEGLRILSARPSDAEMAGIEHRLYGHVPGDTVYSAGGWQRDMAPLLAELAERGRLPIVCGGTGLYFKALLGGFDELAEVPQAIRERWRARMAAEGPAALHAVLGQRDPEAATRLRPTDPQRILRALELGEATGGPLSALQRRSAPGLLRPDETWRITLAPPRPLLRERIALRFAAMLEEGGIEEARFFRQRFGAIGVAGGQAIGLAELWQVEDGELSLAEAQTLAVTRTRQYAKRQETWFRNQFDAEWRRFESAEAAERALSGAALP
ncbi:tRNA (adenosine(37)-N6)-dimethylallyltransferase MiaA [Aureimonas pseudogalii]|uniref:tRNA dimethylallyltransferase n=1 Tax=Aureimonas pseudogalii TaxID=1744844 RepID=A0A7W6H3W7_9HYPH|nr:tRNA (adenosine(37)-N6)-dimethylallyltransferase MiaA [Aureimonas pseudogalii]MBB3998491.1 tRNA dimethylallyltransferase [Aureimonas pseudogalii]